MFFRKGRGSGQGGSARDAGTPAANATSLATGAGETGLRLPPAPAQPVLQLDNRGLQPPEPMVRILSALDQLQPGQVLQAHNDRRPMFLLPHLDERGFEYAMADQDDGSVIIRIWRPAAAAAPVGIGEGAAGAGAAPAGPAGPDGVATAATGAAGGATGTAAAATAAAGEAIVGAARGAAPAEPGIKPGGGPGGGAVAGGPDETTPEARPGEGGEGLAAEEPPATVEPLVMDVRPYFARRQEPFRDIMANVARLQPGQPFVLIVGFEPVPLYWVMKRKGFEHRAERDPDGAWRVTFWRPQR